MQRLAERVRRRNGKNWNGKETCADNTQREQGEGKLAGDRFQCLRSLRRAFNVRLARRVQRRSHRDHDAKGDEIGKRHAHEGIESNSLVSSGGLYRLFDQRLAAWSCRTSSASCDACQKKR